MRKWKAYLIMMPLAYKILVLAIVPISLCILSVITRGELGVLFHVFYQEIFMIFFVGGEFYLMGGIFEKSKERLDLYKNSGDGMKVYKGIFRLDFVFKGIFILAFILFICWINGEISWLQTLDYMMVNLAVLYLASFVVRFIDAWNYMPMAISGAIMAIAIANIRIAHTFTDNSSCVTIAVVGFIVSVLVGLLNEYFVKRKIKESYHD